MQVRLVKTYCKLQAENYRVFFEFCKPFMVPPVCNVITLICPSPVFSGYEQVDILPEKWMPSAIYARLSQIAAVAARREFPEISHINSRPGSRTVRNINRLSS